MWNLKVNGMDAHLGRRLFFKKPVAEGHYLKAMDPKLNKTKTCGNRKSPACMQVFWPWSPPFPFPEKEGVCVYIYIYMITDPSL